MSDYEIEKDQPMPAESPHKGRVEKYPWSKLGVGMSFFIPGGVFGRVKSSASKASKRSGKTFVVRRMDGGVRVWRSS
jgi:hypothetical protein